LDRRDIIEYMPREPHPVFDREIQPDAPVWRYFDFPRFVALLQSHALYFSRADLLGDPLEGTFTKAYTLLKEQMLREPPEGKTKAQLEEVFRHNAWVAQNCRREAYVNCWHLGNHESMAMWQGYGGGPYGVAIRTTFQKLDAALPSVYQGPWREDTIFVGRVRYIDYTSSTERLPHEGNVYGQMMCKSLPYSHENELRAIFLDSSTPFASPADAGHNIPISLEDLVTAVVVSPLGPPWFEAVVGKACAIHGLGAPIVSSIAAIQPVY
jgi:hypothetical protein